MKYHINASDKLSHHIRPSSMAIAYRKGPSVKNNILRVFFEKIILTLSHSGTIRSEN